MNKELIKTELYNILKENLDKVILKGNKPALISSNKTIFKNLKTKYPNILLSPKYLIEICKHKNSFDGCLGLFYCKCGNEKAITSKFCSNHNCPAKNKSVGINCKNTKLIKYGDANYNNMNKHKQTCLERYGVDNILKSEEFKKHSKKVKFEKYGNEKFTNRQKAKRTCLEKYGKSSYMETDEFKDKSKEYFQEHYNKDYFFETDEFQAKRRQTCLDKFGVDSFSKTENFKNKTKDVWFNNYGVVHPMKVKEIKDKVKKTMNEHWGAHYTKTKYFKDLYKNNEFKNKMKDKEFETRIKNGTIQKDLFKDDEHYRKWLNKFTKTMLQRYGKPYYTQTKSYKDLYNNKEWVEEKVIKGQNTKKEKGTTNTSVPELEIFEILKTKFQDIIHLYKDNKYNFECDFYIPSKKLYIELNFHWTHGFEPFNAGNDEHIKLINYWMEKAKEIYTTGEHKGDNKDYYSKAIYVWTELDPKKLKCFKDNNLNYKIFYNRKEFDSWFKEQ